MIVCDLCKSPKVMGYNCRVAIFKEDRSPRKAQERQVVSMPLHICDRCVTNLSKELGKAIGKLRQPHAPIDPLDLDPTPEELAGIETRKAEILQEKLKLREIVNGPTTDRDV